MCAAEQSACAGKGERISGGIFDRAAGVVGSTIARTIAIVVAGGP